MRVLICIWYSWSSLTLKYQRMVSYVWANWAHDEEVLWQEKMWCRSWRPNSANYTGKPLKVFRHPLPETNMPCTTCQHILWQYLQIFPYYIHHLQVLQLWDCMHVSWNSKLWYVDGSQQIIIHWWSYTPPSELAYTHNLIIWGGGRKPIFPMDMRGSGV